MGDILPQKSGRDFFGVIYAAKHYLHLSLAEIETNLLARLPIVACVHTADLGYWSRAVDHVVVVVGLDEQQVYVNDPSLSTGQQPVPRTEFELAQLHYDNLCAIIQR
jgi:predicted double-glycine peptidase